MTTVIVYQAGSGKPGAELAYTPEQSQAAHNFNVIPVPAKKDGFFVAASRMSLKISKYLALIGVALLIYVYGPSVWFWGESKIGNFVDTFALSQVEVQNLSAIQEAGPTVYEPPFDPKLPIINHLSIGSIGVDTDIQEASYVNYEEALKKGVWRVSDFGAPTTGDRPTILAAHRFGYLAWTNSFRHKSSFYNLPKLKVGDVVNVVWRQRKYTYEVYATDKSTEIGDYSADLILYTCVKLNGPDRIFVYARLLQV